MLLADPAPGQTWRAHLRLGFARRGPRTVAVERRHEGPLRVQKLLHPEGEAVCHAIVVHPPGGICGGDEIELSVHAYEDAHALLTTPGAAKWYRSAGALAVQHARHAVAAGAVLEWLPQETIVFDGAQARMRSEIGIEPGGAYLGWEIMALGRTAAGERFRRGQVAMAWEIREAGRLLWHEAARIEGDSPLLAAAAGLAGCPVHGTLIAVGRDADAGLMAALRAVRPAAGEGSVTALPRLVIARYLGAATETARTYFIELWRVLRPALAGREAQPPRIWST
jgi:urease accessory protein